MYSSLLDDINQAREASKISAMLHGVAFSLIFVGDFVEQPSSEPAEQGGEVSAFRIAVPRPRATANNSFVSQSSDRHGAVGLHVS